MTARRPAMLPALVAGIVLLAACSSAPPSSSAPTGGGVTTVPPPAPTPARTLPVAHDAFATVYRTRRLVGTALNTSVHIDGVEVAELDNGTYVRVRLGPGAHTFYADDERDALTVTVEAGREYYFRTELVSGAWGGHGKLQRVDAAAGAAELKAGTLKPATEIRDPRLVVSAKP